MNTNRTKLILAGALLAAAFSLRAQTFPAISTQAVTTNSLGSLLTGFNVGSGVTLSLSSGGTFDFVAGTLSFAANQIPWAALPAGTGTVLSVNLSGGVTGLTFLGSNITTTPNYTMGGTLAVSNGGTGVGAMGSGFVVSSGTAFSVSNSIPVANINGAVATIAGLNGITVSTGGQVVTLSLPLTLAGAGTLTVTTATTLTGGGALALGGFTGTLPASGTFALLGTAQTFTAAKTITVASGTALTLNGNEALTGTLSVTGGVVATGSISAGAGIGFANNGYLTNAYNGMMNVIPGYGFGYFQNAGGIAWIPGGNDAIGMTGGTTTTTSAPSWWVVVQTGVEHPTAIVTGTGSFTGAITSSSAITAGTGSGFATSYLSSAYTPLLNVAPGYGLGYYQNSGGISWLTSGDALAITGGTTSTASAPTFWVGVQTGVTHTTGVVTGTGSFTGNLTLATTSISGLPAANSATYSYRTVTDSTTSLAAATIGSTPSGGGSYSVPIWSNGAAWVIP